MKFLNVYCTQRKAEVYVNLDKIVLLAKEDEGKCRIELLSEAGAVEVEMPAEELVRKINGEDRAGIGFRTSH